ncbi:MAG: polysaccharide deacetylase family protein [Paracoccaceae bacterium]
MPYDFSPLKAELKLCRTAGMAIPIWWRDDDAIQATNALDQLLTLADEVTCPVHLAAIPAFADRSLVAATDDRLARILVHGWAHVDSSLPDAKKSEFGRVRPDVFYDLERAHHRMKRLFGTRVWPMFVPPWNRTDLPVLQRLPDFGFSAVSTFGPRGDPIPNLVQINTHIDPIFWRGTRDLQDPDLLIEQTVQVLQDRREQKTDANEPLGLLTHHLVHTCAIWDFSRAWLLEMLSGGAHVWKHDQKGDWP